MARKIIIILSVLFGIIVGLTIYKHYFMHKEVNYAKDEPEPYKAVTSSAVDIEVIKQQHVGGKLDVQADGIFLVDGIEHTARELINSCESLKQDVGMVQLQGFIVSNILEDVIKGHKLLCLKPYSTMIYDELEPDTIVFLDTTSMSKTFNTGDILDLKVGVSAINYLKVEDYGIDNDGLTISITGSDDLDIIVYDENRFNEILKPIFDDVLGKKKAQVTATPETGDLSNTENDDLSY